MLAYHRWNYLTSCKQCNSPYKSNYFPIAGKRRIDAADPRGLKTEKAYLIYPLGALDADPEKVITFEGLVPHAAAQGGFTRDRGEVTIAFFKLASREELRVERAFVIRTVYEMLAQGGKLTIQDAQPHAACARAFVRLYRKDRKAAADIYQQALALLKSKGWV